MANDPTEILDLRTASGAAVNRAMARGVRAELIRNKLAGNTVVVWQDGKIVHIPPDALEIFPEPEPIPTEPKS
ncbi:MAG: hypothetical protein U0800_10735 [Isosphaeraceae bacterium]